MTSTPLVTPSGRPGFKIECASEREACDGRALRDCPHGYALISASEHYVPFSSGNGGQMVYSETVACAAPAREP